MTRNSRASGFSAPGTIHAMGMAGSVTFGPKEGRTVLFGRSEPDVHICLGHSDRAVSRQHGVLRHHKNLWWVQNTGQRPLILRSSRMVFGGDEPFPLDPGYTPLFVRGSRGRQYMLELYVIGQDGGGQEECPGDSTLPPRVWSLKPVERLVLTVLAQRYLMHDMYQHPLTWRDTADQLGELQPSADWTAKRAERLVNRIRLRLSGLGVSGLTKEEVGQPVGNALSHNLIGELMQSTTLSPADLRLLENPLPGSVEHDD